MYEAFSQPEQIEALFNGPNSRSASLPGYPGLKAFRKSGSWHGFSFGIRLKDSEGEWLPLETLNDGTPPAQAIARWVEIKGPVQKGELVLESSIKLNAAAKKAWEALDKEVEAGRKAAGVAKDYRNNYRLHIQSELGNRQLKKISRGDLIRWRDGLTAEGYSPSSVNYYISTLAYVYTVAFNEGWISQQLRQKTGTGFRTGAETREGWEAKVIRPEDMVRLVNAMPEIWEAPTALLAGSGARCSEVAGTIWDDLSLVRGSFKIEKQLLMESGDVRYGTRTVSRAKTKNKRGVRELPMTPHTREVMEKHFTKERKRGFGQGSDFLFISNRRKGRPFSSDSLSKAIKREAEKLGLGNVTAQTLRRSYCTALAGMIARGEAGDLTDADAAMYTGHSLQVWRDNYVKSYDDARSFEATRGAVASMGL